MNSKKIIGISLIVLVLTLLLAGGGVSINKPQNSPESSTPTTTALRILYTDTSKSTTTHRPSTESVATTNEERADDQTKITLTLPEKKTRTRSTVAAETTPGTSYVQAGSVSPTTEGSTSKTSVNTEAPLTTEASSSTSQAPPQHSAGAIAITFDDGPGPYTAQLLDTLQAYGVRATFFVLGSRAEAYPGLISRMHNEGHQLGNHSYSHEYLSMVNSATLQSQLSRTSNIIANITGVSPVIMRPPGGYGNQAVYQEAGRQGMATIYWHIDPADWKYRDSQYVYNYLLNYSSGGSIILLHDIHKTTVDGFIRALPVLIDRGFTFVTVSELVALSPGDVYPYYWR